MLKAFKTLLLTSFFLLTPFGSHCTEMGTTAVITMEEFDFEDGGEGAPRASNRPEIEPGSRSAYVALNATEALIKTTLGYLISQNDCDSYGNEAFKYLSAFLFSDAACSILAGGITTAEYFCHKRLNRSPTYIKFQRGLAVVSVALLVGEYAAIGAFEGCPSNTTDTSSLVGITAAGTGIASGGEAFIFYDFLRTYWWNS